MTKWLNMLKNNAQRCNVFLCVLQTSYIRRERAYQMQVEDLQNQLAVARRGGIEEGLATDTMDKIRQQHRQIMDDINGIHVRTSNKIKGSFQVFFEAHTCMRNHFAANFTLFLI